MPKPRPKVRNPDFRSSRVEKSVQLAFLRAHFHLVRQKTRMDHGPPGLGSDTAGVAEPELYESFDLIWGRMDIQNRTELLDSNLFTVANSAENF